MNLSANSSSRKAKSKSAKERAAVEEDLEARSASATSASSFGDVSGVDPGARHNSLDTEDYAGSSSRGTADMSRSAKESRPELAQLLSDSKVVDGTGQTIFSEGGPTLAAQGPKDAVLEALSNEIVRKAAAGEYLRPTEAFVADMARGLADTALDAPTQTPEQQAKLVKSLGQYYAADMTSSVIEADIEVYDSVNQDLEQRLKEGSAEEKLAVLDRLGRASETLSAQSESSRPQMNFLAQTLQQVVPDVTALSRVTVGMDQLDTLLKEDVFNALTSTQRQDLGEAVLELAQEVRTLPAAALDPATLALTDQLDRVGQAIQAEDRAGGEQLLAQGKSALVTAIEATAQDVVQRIEGPIQAELSANLDSLRGEAQLADMNLDAPAEGISNSWSAMQSKDELNWGQLAEPLRALSDTRDAGTLRELLGASAKEFSDAELREAVSPQDQMKAQEMGLSGEQVQEAVLELRAEALREGRDEGSVDEVVALEALVGQQRTLEERGSLNRSELEDKAEIEEEAEMSAGD